MSTDSNLLETGVHREFETNPCAQQNRSAHFREETHAARCVCAHLTGPRTSQCDDGQYFCIRRVTEGSQNE